MRSILVVVGLLVATAVAAPAADPPNANDLVARMKATLEPAKSSVRRLDLTISGDHGGASQWVVAQARKVVDGQPRLLTVVLAPLGHRGIASLITDGTPPSTALYVPVVRRVRTLIPQDGYDAFLGSDFTFFDLGFVRRSDAYTLAGAEARNGTDAWKLEQIPANRSFYSRIVMWIDKATLLPIEIDYFGPAGELWKVQTFDKIVTIDGQPAATSVTMKDTLTGGTSQITISKLKFDVDLPSSLFERAGLPEASSAPIFKGLE
jgi:hypothetical protein